MDELSILLISDGSFENDFLENIAREVELEFKKPVSIEDIRIDLIDFYDPIRRQYDGNGILKEIDASSSFPFVKKLVLFRVDLFIPILTFIFGQAVLNGCTGIASIYRLRNEQYGMKKDDNLLFNRFKKVVIHELGHSFGLLHCHVPTCVMRSSTYVEDIDQKSHKLCNKCRDEIGLSN